MTAKDILFSTVARNQLARGLDALANAVKVTLGPRGRNVLLDKPWGSPAVTKDGVSVAKDIELADHFTNLGAQMVKEVASKTAEAAGDGTTTATVLAQAIYRTGAKLVSAGVSPMDLKRGIDAAVAAIVEDLKRQSKPIQSPTEIAQVATVSANGDAVIGDLIAEAMAKVGKEGVVSIEEAQGLETSLRIVEGLQFERGYLSPYFVTDAERLEVRLENAHVLICDKRLSSLQDLLPLLEAVSDAGKQLLIIAEDIDGEALAALVVNKLRGTLRVCGVKAPGFGDNRRAVLQDIAVLSGGRVITEELGVDLRRVALDELGTFRTVSVDKDKTTLVGGAGKKQAIEGRASELRAQLEQATSDDERGKLQERLGKITGGVALLEVGAFTETEMKEKKARVDDALHATRAAALEGIVPGGGVALLRALPALEALKLGGDERLGVEVMRRAVEEPLRQMVQNAGGEGAVVLDRVRQGSGAYGYNVATDRYEDLIAAGVLDPTKVVRVALQSAASVASLMLTTEAAIAVRAAQAQTGGAG